MADTDPNALVEIEHSDPKVQGDEPPATVRRGSYERVWKARGFRLVTKKDKEKANG